MNSAPGHIPEELTNKRSVDRRQMMKLISFDSPRRRSRLRIDVDDELLRPTLGRVNTSDSQKTAVKGRSDTIEMLEDESVLGGAAIIAGVAVMGLAVGYLMGRLRNR